MLKEKTKMHAAEFSGANKAVRYAVIGVGKCLQLSAAEKAANKAAAYFAEVGVEAVRHGFDVAPDGGSLLTGKAQREALIIIEPDHWIRNNKGNVVALREGKTKSAKKTDIAAQCFAVAASMNKGNVPVDLCNKVAKASKEELIEILNGLTASKAAAEKAAAEKAAAEKKSN